MGYASPLLDTTGPEIGGLISLIEWLGNLDVGWAAVLEGEDVTVDVVSGNGRGVVRAGTEAVADNELLDRDYEKGGKGSDILTQTEKTRLKSLLITGAARIEEWLEGVRPGSAENEEEEQAGEYVDALEKMGLREVLDHLFEETLRDWRWKK